MEKLHVTNFWQLGTIILACQEVGVNSLIVSEKLTVIKLANGDQLNSWNTPIEGRWRLEYMTGGKLGALFEITDENLAERLNHVVHVDIAKLVNARPDFLQAYKWHGGSFE